ncbi:ferritin-like domain-containing protein, partial [Arthrospira platensis SPKY1]|nr:ferritin-like domain-containing protein [Arthrospira platensis SPKY1]
MLYAVFIMDNKTTAKVAKSLNLVLADSYALMAQTHFCHWNVEGPGFFALHNAFEEQYTELFAA